MSGRIYANCCCLNTWGPLRPFHPTQHITTARPSNKAHRLVSFPPLWASRQPPQLLPPSPLCPALQRLAKRHGSMADRLMRRKYFYRIAFRVGPENQWQCFLWISAPRLGTFYLFISSGFYGEGELLHLSDTDHNSLTCCQNCSSNLSLKTPPQTSYYKAKPKTTVHRKSNMSNSVYESSSLSLVELIDDLDGFPCQRGISNKVAQLQRV